MDSELTTLLMVISIQGYTDMASHGARESIYGDREQCMKVTLKMAKSKVKGDGRRSKMLKALKSLYTMTVNTGMM